MFNIPRTHARSPTTIKQVQKTVAPMKWFSMSGMKGTTSVWAFAGSVAMLPMVPTNRK